MRATASVLAQACGKREIGFKHSRQKGLGTCRNPTGPKTPWEPELCELLVSLLGLLHAVVQVSISCRAKGADTNAPKSDGTFLPQPKGEVLVFYKKGKAKEDPQV